MSFGITHSEAIEHDLSNALNNIGLLVGNAAEQLQYELAPAEATLSQLRLALQQISRANALVREISVR